MSTGISQDSNATLSTNLAGSMKSNLKKNSIEDIKLNTEKIQEYKNNSKFSKSSDLSVQFQQVKYTQDKNIIDDDFSSDSASDDKSQGSLTRQSKLCQKHKKKKAKYYIQEDEQNLFCSKCALYYALNGQKVLKQMNYQEILRKNTIVNFLTKVSDLRQQSQFLANKIIENQQNLKKIHQLNQQKLTVFFEELSQQIEESKTEYLKHIDERFNQKYENLDFILQQLDNNQEQVTKFEQDINKNQEQIIRNMEMKPFFQIIERYMIQAQKQDNFLRQTNQKYVVVDQINFQISDFMDNFKDTLKDRIQSQQKEYLINQDIIIKKNVLFSPEIKKNFNLSNRMSQDSSQSGKNYKGCMKHINFEKALEKTETPLAENHYLSKSDSFQPTNKNIFDEQHFQQQLYQKSIFDVTKKQLNDEIQHKQFMIDEDLNKLQQQLLIDDKKQIIDDKKQFIDDKKDDKRQFVDDKKYQQQINQQQQQIFQDNSYKQQHIENKQLQQDIIQQQLLCQDQQQIQQLEKKNNTVQSLQLQQKLESIVQKLESTNNLNSQGNSKNISQQYKPLYKSNSKSEIGQAKSYTSRIEIKFNANNQEIVKSFADEQQEKINIQGLIDYKKKNYPDHSDQNDSNSQDNKLQNFNLKLDNIRSIDYKMIKKQNKSISIANQNAHKDITSFSSYAKIHGKFGK